jgi:protein tyrosine/serine phosphatase
MLVAKLSRRIIFFSLIIILSGGIITFFSFSKSNKEYFPVRKPIAEKIELKGFNNLYKISDTLYRSEQPGDDEMKELEKMGIRTVLNLRNYHNDKNEAQGTSLVLERIRMNASEITQEQIFQAMKIIKDSPKPVLVHCFHGSDRTGCMVASYRIIFQNWTKEAAIEELKNPAFGYHASWFPNILEALRAIDVNKMRKDLEIK